MPMNAGIRAVIDGGSELWIESMERGSSYRLRFREPKYAWPREGRFFPGSCCRQDRSLVAIEYPDRKSVV